MADSNTSRRRVAWAAGFQADPGGKVRSTTPEALTTTSTVGTDDDCGQYYTETNGAGSVHPLPPTKRAQRVAWFRQLQTLKQGICPAGGAVHPSASTKKRLVSGV